MPRESEPFRPFPSVPGGLHQIESHSVELDLQCEREQWATVHTLRWDVDRNGAVTNKECICKSCPRGANTRPWPTKLELQDAGAASDVPRSEADDHLKWPYTVAG
jgi:hypothetical protein